MRLTSFRSFKEKNTLRLKYLKSKNNKYATNKVLRRSKARKKVRLINIEVKMLKEMYAERL